MMRGCLRWTDKMAERNKIERSLITFISFFFFFLFALQFKYQKRAIDLKRSCLSKGGVGLDLGIGTGGANGENYCSYRQKGGLSCNKQG